ncbi:MAG: hypothetical protein GWP09_00900 [Nitrospiraceae bacterium]|nr:hypothetical protein [Nitrospiraceae bacterium]
MKDVSKTTIAVLLVLTIIVSLIGTWATIQLANKVSSPSGQRNYGIVSLSISKPPVSPPVASSTSQVSLSISQPNKS